MIPAGASVVHIGEKTDDPLKGGTTKRRDKKRREKNIVTKKAFAKSDSG